VGSKIRVQGISVNSGRVLNLAEVEVLGTPLPPPSRGLRSSSSKRSVSASDGSIETKDILPLSSSSTAHPKNRNLATVEQLELSEARKKWGVKGPLNYDFVLERVNFLGHDDETGPFFVRVRSDAVNTDGVTYAETGKKVDLLLVDDVPFTVEGLFATIDEGLKRGAYEKVTYDPEMGYPVDIYSLDEEGEDDDDEDAFAYALSGFARALGGAGEPCDKNSNCLSNECLDTGICADEALA